MYVLNQYGNVLVNMDSIKQLFYTGNQICAFTDDGVITLGKYKDEGEAENAYKLILVRMRDSYRHGRLIIQVPLEDV